MSLLPPGKLIVTRYQTRYKWYVNDGQNLIYIPKSQRHYAEALAKRKYLTLRLKDLTREKNSINFFLTPHAKNINTANQLLLDSHYHELLSPYFQLTDQELIDWASSPYERNLNHPEKLVHHSISGNIVRSKSEAIIDMALYVHQIPFRYECSLLLKDIQLFPDFTLLHPHTRQLFYWEHFGMMDNESYAKNSCTKLNLYTSNNIIPSINLITTYETKEHPLSSSLVEEIIQHYFL